MILGIVSVLLFTVAPIVLVVLLVRHASSRQGPRAADGRSVRRFFQYLLLFGLMVVAAVGVSDLLARPFAEPSIVGDDGAALARTLTFTVFGIPMFVATAVWSRRRLRADPEEARSLGWSAYSTVAPLTALVIAMVALYDVLAAALQGEVPEAAPAVRVVVWTAVWLAHWILGIRLLDAARRQGHLVLGSLIGIVTGLGGLVWLLGAAVDALLVDRSEQVLTGGGNELAQAGATLLVGAPVWFVYWLRGLARAERTPLWLGYVLPLGVGGSLVMAVVGASLALHRTLVWFVGEPAQPDAVEHFDGTTTAVAALVVGAVSWWYHRQVLAGVSGARTEITRVYEYLMAGIALLAAAAGVAMVVVAAVEAAVPAAAVEIGTSVANSLLAAVTLLLVGGPLWWLFWSRIGRAVRQDQVAELASRTRRTYLFLLFGAGGVAAVIAVLVAAFVGIQGALDGGLGAETVRDMRIPVAILLTSGAISGYHWVVYREDRRHVPAPEPHRGPRYVLLVGAADGALADAVSRRTGARVDLWVRDDGGVPPWVVEDVLAAVGGAGSEAVAVLAGPTGLDTFPIHR
ncbi:DUF5671 domain-containing protein [Cellulomonas sp. KRMCY2]|uniref:DUF5671 domain-containing protein n=1 Tax=Cellulomonas sp. KRMCY2 TaxID=1304865 RepID=UPI00045E8685|nr:DUF5671 domain-containing protein [Cellulomonas sp. KRMCY2]